MDMNHGLPFVPPVHIHAGEYPDCKEADVIILTAGARQKPGETRLDLVDRNAQICKSIVDSITPYTTEALLLVVTNPVDIMTYAVVKHSGLPPRQVIGSGTVLDSARFRYLLSQHCSYRYPQCSCLCHRRARRQRGTLVEPGSHGRNLP